ncbi:acyl-CoA-binding protein [Flavobacterium sp. MAH-1]|uniref:Acyl-CoA-binding protein n=1 Tax=Flavobacterium agri TaxID=2743471 RepID=A0A7Y8Y3X8_9FLAO|nr:acyl-CoA-binding protein [Flavobacterium agri]NUY82125.1 acyl-CoA-binding protein [Flavobacterium agri]NYA72149.1 acyl-CoA-binding protein [Flavobacterium agri]
MSETDLDKRFQEAFETASQMSQADLPQDTQLRLYAYYKQGSIGQPTNLNSGFDLRNAFKTNAWMQIRNMDSDEAKRLYIELVESLQKK